MSVSAKVLCFAGSLRAASYNKKLVKIAMSGAQSAGADVTYIDLREFPMPIYDEDIEKGEGLPPNARKLKDLFLGHHALLIAAPEYNSSITAVLKNTLDWVSRPAPGEKNLECFHGKVAGLVAASPGAMGGLRGLSHVREILQNVGVMVIPKQVAVGRIHELLAEDGGLKDEKLQIAVREVGANVARVTMALAQNSLVAKR